MHLHSSRYNLFIVTLVLFLICGSFGCSKSSDPSKTESPSPTTGTAPGSVDDREELKQTYLAFMEKFQLESFKYENTDLLSTNQSAVSEAISELEGLQGEIKEPKTQEIYDKYLGLLKEYNEAASVLERATEETKSAREDLDRREAEARAKSSNPQETWKSTSELIEITQERSKLADYRNLGEKRVKVESLETSLYWLHKDFGMSGLRK